MVSWKEPWAANQVLVLLPTDSVALVQSVYLTGPQLVHLQNGGVDSMVFLLKR